MGKEGRRAFRKKEQPQVEALVHGSVCLGINE